MAKASRGTRGPRGPRGHRGPQGRIGPRGPAAQKWRASDVKALFDDQIHDLKRALDIQVRRCGELQAQVDRLNAVVKRLVERDDQG